MFTTVAYHSNFTASNVLTYLQALADQHVRVEGTNVVVPAGMGNLLGAFAIGASLTRAMIESPSLRRTALLDLPDTFVGAVPQHPLPYFNAFYNPLPLDEFEPLRALTSKSSATAEDNTVVVWLGDGPQAPVAGEMYTVYATSYTTLEPYKWTNGQINFTQTLPAGRYQVVGMKARASGLIAARLVFVGGTWRPGCPGATRMIDYIPEIFRRGGLGIWGEFTHDQPPTVDFLSAVDESMEFVWLDLVKVA